ncbi:MAG: glycosyltransferase [Candidatus Rokubacteria bacterium]|nr:glycosyltransferase [Candidatus Rokubacteria bacterium]
MKQLLMVAHGYPPAGGSSGVQRPLKFSRFLPEYGWLPQVLTPRADVHRFQDPSLLAEIPAEVLIHRTPAWNSARDLGIRGWHLAALAIPDQFVSWVPFAVRRGLAVIRAGGIRAIYSTSPPATTQLVAWALHRRTGLPWVADFRDPWIEEGIHPRPGSLRYRIEAALERRVLRDATVVTVTTPHLRGDFLRRHHDLHPERVRVVWNGYDEADFHDFRPEVSRERFELIHTGLVTAEFRDPRPVLRALAELIAAGDIDRERTRAIFVGGGPWLRSSEFTASVAEMELGGVVEIERFVPHREALARLGRAAALLLMQASDDTRSLIPAKAFEYLRAGLPILALTFEGATTDLVKGLPRCFVVHPADEPELRRVVKHLYDLWREAPDALAVPRPVQQYERRHLTAALADALDEVAGTRSGREARLGTEEATP